MSYLDFLFLLLLICFLVIGFIRGSIWLATCLIGGFFGAYLADTYNAPIAGMMGGFSGSFYIAGGLLFLGGVLVALVPGWFLSKIGIKLFGLFDRFFGLIVGAIAGLCMTAILLMFVFPKAPSIEKSNSWKRSTVLKPYHRFLVKILMRSDTTISESFSEELLPAVEKVEAQAKDATRMLMKKVRK